MLRVLQIVQQLLQQNRHATKRDVYYSNPAILKGELDLKRILLWCIIILHIKSLHIFTFLSISVHLLY
jgi:meiotic recombination protein SPO11